MKSNRLQHHILIRIHYLFLCGSSLLFYLCNDHTLRWLPLALTVLYILFFEIFLLLRDRNKRRLAYNIVEMLNMTSQKRLMDFPIPVVVSEKNGTVLWYNERFIEHTEPAFLQSFTSVSQLSNDILGKTVAAVKLGHHHFRAYSDCCILNDKEMLIYYLFETTDYYDLMRKYNNSRPIVAHIVIDNYDEVFANLKEIERSSAMVRIDEEINAWAQSAGGIFCHLERDRYLFIFENENLAEFVNNRFDILERVRAMTPVNRLTPTLSIGIGLGENGFGANEEGARQALDMALSRGGDQAVIKTASGYEFFGARNRGVERRTRIKTRVVANAMQELLRDAENAIVMGHAFSDMDSLGACVGVTRIMKANNVPCHIYVNGDTTLATPLYDRIKESPDYRNLLISKEDALNMINERTMLILVDTHRGNYTDLPELIDRTNQIVVIDHHRKAVDYIKEAILFYHEPYASSACEMVSELLHYMDNGTLTAFEAEALLAGIFLDTKNYTIRTNICTFETSSYLRKAGANTVNVKRMFQTDMDTYKQKVRIINTTEIHKKIMAIATWEGDMDSKTRIASSQAADEMLNIEHIQASFTLTADKSGNVNISARSFGAVNVQLICEKLGGGGHQTMAGAQLRNVSIETARTHLISALDAYMTESNMT